MPRQNRALDARRQVAHASEYGEASDMMGAGEVELSGRHVAKFLDECLRVGTRLTLDGDCHHRCRRLADRARLAPERDLADALAVEIERHGDVIAAQRVMAFRMVARM